MSPKKVRFQLALLLLAALSASATTLLASPLCAEATFATYLTPNYSCNIGQYLFSNFTYTSTAQGGALPVTPDGIDVNTIGPAGSGANILDPDTGLQFSGGWVAGPGQITDSAFGFTITALPGTPSNITDAAIAQLSGGVTLGGLVTLAEQGCSPAPCLPTTWSEFTFNDGSPLSQLAAETMFSPTGSVTVIKDLTVDGGSTGVGAESRIGDKFSHSDVPEPTTLFLSGSALLLAGIFRRRIKGSR